MNLESKRLLGSIDHHQTYAFFRLPTREIWIDA